MLLEAIPIIAFVIADSNNLFMWILTRNLWTGGCKTDDTSFGVHQRVVRASSIRRLRLNLSTHACVHVYTNKKAFVDMKKVLADSDNFDSVFSKQSLVLLYSSYLLFLFYSKIDRSTKVYIDPSNCNWPAIPYLVFLYYMHLHDWIELKTTRQL